MAMDIKNLPLHYLVQREIFFLMAGRYFTSMNFLAFSFSASVNLGNVMFSTPFSTWAQSFLVYIVRKNHGLLELGV